MLYRCLSEMQPLTKEQEREQLEKKDEKKSSSFFENVPTIIWIAAAIIIFLAWNSMKYSKSSSQIIVIIIIIAILFIISRKGAKIEEKPLAPRDAELLVERDLERKKQWGQFPPMTTYRLNVEEDLMHIDERGTHYNIGVTLSDPFNGPINYVAKVGAKGEEKGFVTFIRCIGEFTGREVRHQKNITNVPGWVRRAKQYPTLERLWGLR